MPEPTFDLDAPSQAQTDLTVVSASDWRTDRVNGLLYGPPGCGKTDLLARCPKPVIVDTGENGILTVKYMLATGRLKDDLPVIPTTKWQHMMEIAASPKYKLAGIFKDTKWEGYEDEMETIGFDTVTTMEGWCLDDILTKAGKAEPDFPETNALRRRMTAFFRAAWNLKYNTILLGHDHPGRAETRDMRGKVIMKKKDPGPLLTGSLATSGPALCDFYLYMLREHRYGERDNFVAYTVEHPDGYPSRTRVEEFLPDRIENPSYEVLREALDKLETKQQEERTNG